MLTAHARIETGRANRYLVQICGHLDQMTRSDAYRMHSHDGGSPTIERVEWSDSDAVIAFDCGTCTLQARPDALMLRVDAADLETRQRIQDMLTVRLQTIGRRDHLEMTWG